MELTMARTEITRRHYGRRATRYARSVVPSTILKKLSASPKQSHLARALRELGRIERSLFMIEWYSSPALRRIPL
ncbi:hypothetical protein EHI42_26155 [Rhizobium hidalgonense]|nr:hypothetical protein EHI42_26155 [Rhizobium hidalgonense]